MNSSFSHLFCDQPFNRIEVNEVGDVYTCCPAWLRKPLGNLFTNSIDEVWNSNSAIEIRESIHDGSYKFCNHQLCPRLKKAEMPRSGVVDPLILNFMNNKTTVLNDGPTKLNCCYDRSCNLRCASCRTELILNKKFSFDWSQASHIQNQLLPLLDQLEWLEVTGSGDPFASPIFFELLQSIDSYNFPNLKIFLHTNGTLWTPERWTKLSGIHSLVKKVDISIDAATENTYKITRGGGDFNNLQNNLAFISKIRNQGLIDDLKFSFVVQAENFHEIPDFIALGKRFKTDRVLFSMIDNWGTFESDIYESKAIHKPEHPLHHQLISIINDPSLDRRFCDFSNLSHLINHPVQ